jgi:CheY-like chemotaxis protein/HPt (histidine-containing phosphotransfer) domain-containing protein
MRILLVEDNEINQQVATELLESAGASVTVAGNGAVAVKMLEEGPQPPEFDVVLMDLQMPVMDGHTAARILRANERFNNLPILAMTAHALVEERERCLAIGMNDHVTKPIDPDALFAALARWVKPRQQTATAPKPAGPAAAATDLPEIEGVDVQGGLKRVAGNRKLFRSLLEQFAAKQADTGAQISEALRNGDRVSAERLAHTVKGVAGNIGIAKVQAAAERLETAIRTGSGDVEKLAAEMSESLAPQVGAIRRALGSLVAEAPSGRRFDPSAAAGAVSRLKALLEANEGDAGDAVDEVAEALAGEVDADLLAGLRSSVAEFDFDGALARLDSITAAIPSAP